MFDQNKGKYSKSEVRLRQKNQEYQLENYRWSLIFLKQVFGE